MADPSPSTQLSAIPSNSLKHEDREAAVLEELIRKPRVRFNQLPRVEETESKYKERVLSLPKEEGWVISRLRKYNDFWYLEEILPGVLAMEKTFKPRPDDVIVTSFMKSGTTWIKALTFTIVHRKRCASSGHLLLKFNPHDCVPMIDFHYAIRDEQFLEALPSPRVLGTHVPYSTLPNSVKTLKCPIVYICREPKDVLVSLWHYVGGSTHFKDSFPFNKIFELFCEGRVPYGPIWNHVLEYYTESLHRTDKVLFLKYEDMMKNPIDDVMKIAKFLGCPFSEEEVKNGAVEEIIKVCSFNNLKDYDANKQRTENQSYFRKAVVGDWRNDMTTEMAAKLDEIVKEKLRHSGFTYGAPSTC